MEEVSEILGFGLQRKEQGRLVELLIREKMDHRTVVRRKSLSERLGFKGISCCGATWTLMNSNITATDGQEGSPAANAHEEEEITETTEIGLIEPEPTCLDQTPTATATPTPSAASGMNLAAALAAERNYRAGQDNSYGDDSSPNPIRADIEGEVNEGSGSGATQPGTPFRVSLMNLLQETDGCDRVVEGGGGDSVCCVCMVRKKGAAFIPCGHTFCRVCSRELWLNRGFCPLCNRSIIEILDIF